MSEKKQKEPSLAESPSGVVVQMPQERPEQITVEVVRQYLCPDATDQELFLFVQLCRSQKLDPWKKEAYLIKYRKKDGGFYPATTIVGKEVFTKRAQANSKFRGFSAGVIVSNSKGELADLEGEFYQPKDNLIGGWAEVFIEGYVKPVRARVMMAEYNKGQSNWNTIPATMIRKVALVHALREAFPDELGGLTDESEIGAITAEFSQVEDMSPKRASEVTGHQEAQQETQTPPRSMDQVGPAELDKILNALKETCGDWTAEEKKSVRAKLNQYVKDVLKAATLNQLMVGDVEEVVAWIHSQAKV